jgi:hypothetical protein
VGDRALQIRVLAELVHRPLAAAHDDRVELIELDVGELRRVLEHRQEAAPGTINND